MDDSNKKEILPMGILRSGSGKYRRASVEFNLFKKGEPTSPQPSVDRLSVTFAETSLKMDKTPEKEVENSDDEDYSASVNAIIQRRASTRKSRRRSSRRTSSPFSPDILLGSENGRRRSSVFTTSSGDTGITIDDNIAVTQEEIFENIKLHKEVLSNVKMQPWNMHKKLRLVVQAKAYIKKHEGALQERLAQSRSTKDMLARCNIYLIKKWQRYRRELANLSNWLVPWELKIKEIESHFGSVVASYFLFLRWLFWVNIVLGVVLISFVAVPEMLTTTPDARKQILKEEKYNSTNFQTLWDFEGVFKYSPLFYGWYTYKEWNKSGYRMPLAYFLTGLTAYAYSFLAILRKMAENSRMSKLSEKDDECIFSWKLFTAWDYMIGNAETAHNRIASIIVGFKEALLEEAEKKREARNWKITCFRILVNTIVLGLLFFSAFAVVLVVKRSTEPEARSSVWRSNEITFVMTFISISFPMIFEGLGFLEQYHPRKQLRLQLARIMVLNLLNLYSLIFALFDKISDMTPELEFFKKILNKTNFQLINSPETHCYNVCYTQPDPLKALNLIAFVTTLYPIVQKTFKPSNNLTTDYDYYYDSNFENITLNNFTQKQETETTELTTEISLKLPQEVATRKTVNISKKCKTVCNNLTSTEDPPLPNFPTLIDETGLNYTTKRKLRSLCWETMFGQELIKLTVMDLVMTILSTLAMDFFRAIFVRTMNRCWCWDLEKKFPQYGDFKVAENILHLVNNQGMVWMGMFFSPGLVVLNIIKLLILMYFRAWIVLTCNVPHEIIFRASRSNNFYYALLLMMLFLCVLPVGYAIVRIPPSGHCGPFSKYQRIFHILTKTIKNNVPKVIEGVLDYIASPGIIIPLLLLLILIIYYLISLTSALREANNDLKIQLRRERTEERRKMFQIVDRRRKGSGNEFSNPTFSKWKKLLHEMPSSTGKSFDDTTTPKQDLNEKVESTTKNKDFLSKLFKKALGKTSISDDDNHDTDTDQHESLPEDLPSSKPLQNINEKSKDLRQDSTSSVWSDNIPVITISKTESAECLDVVPETNVKFKPKIKCVLRKQSTEVDEDVICYFGKDLKADDENNIKEKDEIVSESSEDTPRNHSTDTVINVKEKNDDDEKGEKIEEASPNGSATESSAEYNDITSL